MEAEDVFFSQTARNIVSNVDVYLLRCQIGEIFSAITAGWILSSLAGDYIRHTLVAQLSFAEGIESLVVTFASLLLVICVATTAFLFIQIAKSFISTDPEKILCYLSFPILYVSAVFAPLEFVVTAVSRKLFRLLQIRRPVERELAISAEEISEIVDYSSEAGEIDDEEREMIQGVFAFADTVVEEVMTPRKDIAYVGYNDSLAKIVQVFHDTGFSRLLVCGEELDDVRGILLAKDLMPYVGRETVEFSISQIIRNPYFVPATKQVDDLLQELKQRALHLAIVLDEHGGVDGIVTVEDLLEEIVGEIEDEFDFSEDTPCVIVAENGDLIVDGGFSVYDLNEDYNFSLPNGEYHTLAGFVFHQLGRIPSEDEVLDYDGLSFKVEKVDQNRIIRVRILAGATAVEDSAKLRVAGSKD